MADAMDESDKEFRRLEAKYDRAVENLDLYFGYLQKELGFEGGFDSYEPYYMSFSGDTPETLTKFLTVLGIPFTPNSFTTGDDFETEYFEGIAGDSFISLYIS